MGVPGLADILPARLSMYVALAVAVAVALWAGAPGRLGTARLAAAAVALVTVVPSPHRDVWTTSPTVPAFFAERLYRRCLRPGETVLMLPVPVQSFAWLWQAQAGYRFRMIDGPLIESPEPSLFLLDVDGGGAPGSARELLALARRRGATAILATAHLAFWQRLLDPFLRPVAVGGVLVYRLGPRLGSCASTGRGG